MFTSSLYWLTVVYGDLHKWGNVKLWMFGHGKSQNGWFRGTPVSGNLHMGVTVGRVVGFHGSSWGKVTFLWVHFKQNLSATYSNLVIFVAPKSSKTVQKPTVSILLPCGVRVHACHSSFGKWPFGQCQ